MAKKLKFKTVDGERYVGMKYHSLRHATDGSSQVYTSYTPSIGRDKVDVWAKDEGYDAGGVYEPSNYNLL